MLLLRPIPKRNDGTKSGGGKRRFTGDGRKQTAMATKNPGSSIADGKKQLEAPPLSLFHRFSERIPPFPFPIPQTTMADAAEHDEELVDYDEEEVG